MLIPSLTNLRMTLKKLDKLVLIPFVGLLSLSLGVTIFILLMQFLLIWFDDLIGKNLGLVTYLQLLLYFGINVTPQAFPLATLVASLITFGNLGEQSALIALKSAGVSLLRVLWPLFIFLLIISSFVLFSNNYLVPRVNLKAYTLLLDLRKKKPSLAIKEGVFYNGIPNYSIRVEKKLQDQKTVQGIIIYDHTQNQGNIAVTIAESGQLYTICNNQYLVIELFNGWSYAEEPTQESLSDEQRGIPSLNRSNFKVQKVIFDLSSFKLIRSSEEIFSNHYTTQNSHRLSMEIAKRKAKIKAIYQTLVEEFQQQWPIFQDTLSKHTHRAPWPEVKLAAHIASSIPKLKVKQLFQPISQTMNHDTSPESSVATSTLHKSIPPRAIQKALDRAKETNNKLKTLVDEIAYEQKELREYEAEKNQRLASAVACIIMFLIGAPLGVLIRRGGIGIPLLIAITFVLLYYVVEIFSIRWVKIGILGSISGPWAPNLILSPFALFFLWQAQQDTRLLDWDAHRVRFEKLIKYLTKTV